MIPALILGAALVATGVLPVQVLGVMIAVAWIILVAAVTSALSAVFKAALYRWANQLPVDPAFDASSFPNAFRHR